MEERHRRRGSGSRLGKLIIPFGGVAQEIARLALATRISPLELMRTPIDVIRALYNELNKRQKEPRRHG